MNDLLLKKGDIFCVRNPMGLGRLIVAAEKFWSKDGTAKYSHAGIITDPEGYTIEALWRVKANSLDAYKGQPMIIGRYEEGFTDTQFWSGITGIQDHIGKIYPFWRLPLFLLPFLAKFISTGEWAVCSELTCKFMMFAHNDLRELIGRWQDQSPDDVYDMITKWKGFKVLFEGEWK